MSEAVRSPMRLQELLAGFVQVPSTLDRPIKGLANDSRHVHEGDLFLATRGLHHHGLEFLTAVRQMGVAAIAWEPPFQGDIEYSDDLPMLAVEGLSRKLGFIAARFYREPSRTLRLIGITGTDGKTSCAHFIAQGLNQEKGVTCGILGTLGYGVNHDLVPASHTTPDALTLQRLLADLRTRGVEHVAMEVSSHALAQDRVAGLSFAVAVFTNLSRDHLDYHGDLAAYAQAKRRLFVDDRTHCAVLNLDDRFGRVLAAELSGRIRVVGYGCGELPRDLPTDFVWAQDLELSSTGMRLAVVSSWGTGVLQAELLGRFNAGNLLAALATLLILGVPFTEGLRRLSRVCTVPGRMERFGGDKGKPLAVVDYAHTPHALEQVLRALREHTKGRLWCVFGCGGERDSGKRPLMGGCAEQYAEQIIVTNDNPRGEDPEVIIRDILAGMEHPGRALVQRDRRAAISQALSAASAKDVVLIAGKGHEDYQLLGSKRVPFSDREVVNAWLEAIS